MVKELILVFIIVAVCVILLCVRLIFGKKDFIHTHVDGNPEMERRGIGCVKRQDLEARLNGGLKIKQHSDDKK